MFRLTLKNIYIMPYGPMARLARIPSSFFALAAKRPHLLEPHSSITFPELFQLPMPSLVSHTHSSNRQGAAAFGGVQTAMNLWCHPCFSPGRNPNHTVAVDTPANFACQFSLSNIKNPPCRPFMKSIEIYRSHQKPSYVHPVFIHFPYLVHILVLSQDQDRVVAVDICFKRSSGDRLEKILWLSNITYRDRPGDAALFSTANWEETENIIELNQGVSSNPWLIGREVIQTI